jgi:hypothetical protein
MQPGNHGNQARAGYAHRETLITCSWRPTTRCQCSLLITVQWAHLRNLTVIHNTDVLMLPLSCRSTCRRETLASKHTVQQPHPAVTPAVIHNTDVLMLPLSCRSTCRRETLASKHTVQQPHPAVTPAVIHNTDVLTSSPLLSFNLQAGNTWSGNFSQAIHYFNRGYVLIPQPHLQTVSLFHSILSCYILFHSVLLSCQAAYEAPSPFANSDVIENIGALLQTRGTLVDRSVCSVLHSNGAS